MKEDPGGAVAVKDVDEAGDNGVLVAGLVENASAPVVVKGDRISAVFPAIRSVAPSVARP